MGIYVKTPTGKEPLQKKITASEIKEALGYTPANPDDINIPDVDIDLSDIESNDDTFYIVDKNDKIVAKIDGEGLHTIEVELGGSGEPKVKVKEHIKDDKIHVTEADKERWDSKNMASSESVTQLTNTVNAHISQYEKVLDTSDDEVFYIVDNNGNIIARFDSEGLHALNVKIGKDGQSVADMIKAEIDKIPTPEIPDVDLSNYYTKIEADAEFMTQTEVDNRINALINAADPEGGKTISDIQNLVKYVEENAGEITGLIDDIQANAQEIANMKDEIVSDKEEFHIVDDEDRIVATIDKNGVQSVAFLDKDGNAFTNLTPLFTHTKKVAGFASEVQTDLGYSAVITLDTKCRSVENVKLLTTNGFNSQEVTISHYEGRITVSGWADSPIKGVYANISYTASHADHASSAETCATTPTIDTHIANKKYVDDEIYKFSTGTETVKTAQTAKALSEGWFMKFTNSNSVYYPPTDLTVGKAYLIAFIVSGKTYTVSFVYMGNGGKSSVTPDGYYVAYNASNMAFTIEDGSNPVTASGFYARAL